MLTDSVPEKSDLSEKSDKFLETPAAQAPEKIKSSSQNFDSDSRLKQSQSEFQNEVKPSRKRAIIQSPKSIADLWAAVLDHYEQERKHQEFILACYRAGCLYYASQKYARILNTAPTDRIALKMQNQIEVFAMKKQIEKPVDKKLTEKLAKKKAFSKSARLSDFAVIVGIAVTLLGFISPSFRNLVGVGIFIFVMAAGFRYFFSRPL